MFEEKITPDQAAKEIKAWLDEKRVSPRKREIYKDAIDTITDALTYGIISINDDNKIVQTLMFPIKNSNGEVSLDKLEYKSRISVEVIQSRMKSAKTGDERINATAAALTDNPTAIIGKLDTEDNTIAQAIAVFFV